MQTVGEQAAQSLDYKPLGARAVSGKATETVCFKIASLALENAISSTLLFHHHVSISPTDSVVKVLRFPNMSKKKVGFSFLRENIGAVEIVCLDIFLGIIYT